MRNLTAAESKETESAIRNLFEDGCAAWNRGDLDEYLASYWDSDQIVWVSGGSLARGKKDIVETYKARFSTPQQMGSLTLTELVIDVLTPADAIAFGCWNLVVESKVAQGFFTARLRKIDSTWLLVHDHSSASEKCCLA